MEDRRADDHKIDSAYALAILYTIGYLGLMFMLMLREIPASNRELLIAFAGIMSAAQLGIIKHYYDGSKAAEQVQAANIARSVKSEAVVQEIAKQAPASTAAAVAATVAATTAAAAPPGTAIPPIPVDPPVEPTKGTP